MIASKRIAFFVAVTCFVLGLVVLFSFDGTGDQGDSILHYLYAKYAPTHPELYFNHWAKPLYVLLASPFAQFGIEGIKFFNLLCISFTAFFTIKVAQEISVENSWFAGVAVIFSPLVIVLTFSGLTEPLFALFLIFGFYLLAKQKLSQAAIIFSFLPFVRSEGLIIIGAIGFFFLLKKNWKALPWLALGHVVYSVLGVFVYGSFFWVFEKIPYSTLSSVYGNGGLFHYVIQLNYVIGVPLNILFWLGVLYLLFTFLKHKHIGLPHLILLTFVAFFVAHSLFWYLGIFNSMGLKRVLIAVIPLIGIIALYGLNLLLCFLKRKEFVRQSLLGVIVMVVLIFPFLSNPASVNWKRDMHLTADQVLINESRMFIDENDLSGARFFHAHPYISEAFEVDHFDQKQRMELTTNYPELVKSGDIIVWDSWFAVVERHVGKEMIDADKNLERLNVFKNEVNGVSVVIALYKVK